MERSHTIGLKSEEFVILKKKPKYLSGFAGIVGLLVAAALFAVWLHLLLDSATFSITEFILGWAGIAICVIGFTETGHEWKPAKINEDLKIVRK